MKVAVDVTAIPEQPAGAGVYVLRVVEALADRDDVDLTVVRRRGRWWPPAARPLRLVWEQTAGPLVARHTDVWHGPHYTMPLLRPGPVVVTIHDLTFFDHPEWHEGSKVEFFRRMIRLSAKRADALLCVSETTARRLHELLEPACPVVVAPHGVDHDRFRPDGEKADLGHRYVLFVGTIEPRKNVPALVRAMRELDADVKLVLAGRPGWGAAEVDAAVATAGLEERVVRLGFVGDDELPRLLRGAAVVAYPSFEEGFGLPALEALACGAPLVTTADTVMAEVAGGSARLVPAGDDDALVDALQAALTEPHDPRPGLSAAAAFTWERSAEQHVEAYRIASGR